MIKLIIAHSLNNVIGNKNQLPWNIKEELQHFKKTTLNSVLLMGKKTFLSINTKLEKRKIIVLTKQNIELGDETIHNENELMQLFQKYKNSKEILFIAGGKSVYEKYFYKADELIVSVLNESYLGDIKINWNLENWNKKLIAQYKEFSVFSYTKKC